MRRGTPFRFLAWIVPALFLAKAGILAARIVPLWDVSDETAHFAYARDIWSGRGVLPIGEAKVGADIMSDVKGQPAGETVNAAAHHPPLYHALAGAVWKLATLFTEDPQILFRAPRLLSPLLGALTLFYVFKLIERMGFGAATALAASASLAAVPRFAWQAAGTSHDILTAALGAASAYYFADYLLGRRPRSAWICAMLMSLAAVTKISGLVVLVPMMACLAFEIPAEDGLKRWAVNVAGLVAAALTLPGIWMVRNLALYGDPFATIEDVVEGLVKSEPAAPIGLLAYLKTFPVIEEFFESLIGHLGWIGRTKGVQSWLDVMPPFRTVYEIIAVLLAATALAWVIRAVWSARPWREGGLEPRTLLSALQVRIPGRLRAALALAAGTFALVILIAAPQVISPQVPSWLLVIAVSAVFAVGPVAALVMITPLDRARRAIFYAILVVVFFCAVLLEQSYSGYLMFGQTWRTVGRFFFVTFGFLMLGFGAPILVALGKQAERITLSVAVLICAADAAFFLTRVVPYFTGSS